MRRASWKGLVLAIALVLVGLTPTTSSLAAGKRKPKKFEVEGSFYGAGVITHSDFIFECPELPATQSVDAFVVEVPTEFGAKPSVATVVATSVSLDPAVELSFYSYGCGQGEELYLNPPVVVPAGTGYIVVQDLQGGNVNFKLTLTQK